MFAKQKVRSREVIEGQTASLNQLEFNRIKAIFIKE